MQEEIISSLKWPISFLPIPIQAYQKVIQEKNTSLFMALNSLNSFINLKDSFSNHSITYISQNQHIKTTYSFYISYLYNRIPCYREKAWILKMSRLSSSFLFRFHIQSKTNKLGFLQLKWQLC
jgi:hypothetical protein